MQLIRKIEEFSPRWQGGALTIGNFDGVHAGHSVIAKRLCHWAEQIHGPAIVFTFDPHPARLLRPDEAPPPLTWVDRKAELLDRLGIDILVAYPTNQELLELDYQTFFQQIIVEKIGARAMVEGPNFYFGKNREGNVNRLTELCSQNEMTLEIVQPKTQGEQFVSSSRIRRCIADGDVESAREMLIEPYRIRGMVTHGAGRGADLGFPTANLSAIDTLVPARGVYAGFAIFEGQKYQAAINIGPNPTFGEMIDKVEVHLLDFDNSVYNNVLEIDFIARVRDIQNFDSPKHLQSQLENDLLTIRKILGT